MSHTPGDTTTNDELLHRIDLVGEHLKQQDIQLSEVRNEQNVVRLELSTVTSRVEDNFKTFDARLLPLERIATTLDRLEKLVTKATDSILRFIQRASVVGALAIIGETCKVLADHFLH